MISISEVNRRRSQWTAKLQYTDEDLAALKKKVNFSGYDRSEGVKVIRKLLEEIKILQEIVRVEE